MSSRCCLPALQRHPDRELRAERRPFAVEILRSLFFTLVTAALALPLRRALRSAAEEPPRNT